MNETLNVINNRKSVRVYEDIPIPDEAKADIINSALRAPTAGNMMLYSILDITDQAIKDKLAVTCDDQPFIAKAPLVLLFLADYQRWYDYYVASGVPELCQKNGKEMRKPQEGDLMLACSDALIAAHSAVIAAESMGIGSCYIGDIIENYETHRGLLELPDYTFPVAMVCFGYPNEQQKKRELTDRFDKEYIVFENKYKRLTGQEFDEMYRTKNETVFAKGRFQGEAQNIGQHFYLKKFSADFTEEMSRSVREALKNWRPEK